MSPRFLLILLVPALSTAQQEIPAGDSTIAVRFANAAALFHAHDDTGEALEEAGAAFSGILSMHPGHAPSLAYLGMIALEHDDAHAADSLLALAAASDSTCPEAHVGRAQWYRKRGRWQEGYAEARRGVRLAPASALARRELVTELLHRAESPVTEVEMNEALPHLQALIRLDANDRDAHLDLAQSFEQLGRWREAAAEYREVLRIGQTPDDMDVWVYEVHRDAARCLERSGDYAEAARELEDYLSALKEFQSDDKTIDDVLKKIQELETKAHH